jgi:hypothetical protein
VLVQLCVKCTWEAPQEKKKGNRNIEYCSQRSFKGRKCTMEYTWVMWCDIRFAKGGDSTTSLDTHHTHAH